MAADVEHKGKRGAAHCRSPILALMTRRSRPPNLHYSRSRLFPLLHAIMGRKDVPAEELLERATANGYKQGAH